MVGIIDKTVRLGLDPSPPDKALVVTRYECGGIGLNSTGPRGGWTYVSIPKSARRTLAYFLLEYLDDGKEEFYCRGCGRAESDCSHDPCDAVKEDRPERLD